MMHTDPRETLEPGQSCELCGDDADYIKTLKTNFDMPLCMNCDHDKVVDCHSCGEWILAHASVTVNGASYCIECAPQLPEVIASVEQDAKADEFNETRR